MEVTRVAATGQEQVVWTGLELGYILIYPMKAIASSNPGVMSNQMRESTIPKRFYSGFVWSSDGVKQPTASPALWGRLYYCSMPKR